MKLKRKLVFTFIILSVIFVFIYYSPYSIRRERCAFCGIIRITKTRMGMRYYRELFSSKLSKSICVSNPNHKKHDFTSAGSESRAKFFGNIECADGGIGIFDAVGLIKYLDEEKGEMILSKYHSLLHNKRKEKDFYKECHKLEKEASEVLSDLMSRKKKSLY